MKKEELSYIYLILFHASLGVLVFALPFVSKIFTISILAFGIYYIIKSKNRNNEVLVMSAYVVSVEVLLRMTDGMLLNEFGKYTILIFIFLGMIYSGFTKAFLYWLFLLLLIPGIVLATLTLDLNTDVRKAIAFNLSGPVCLGICAIYCYQRKISFDRLLGVITAFSLPLIAVAVYLFLYTPSVKAVVTGTQSNFETSGGFGPNQVSTILGLGVFIFFVQLVLNSKSKLLQILNAGFVIVFAFRGIVTFSRGGIFTAIAMVFIFLGVMYYQANYKTKFKIGMIIMLSFVAGIGVWGYSSLQTNGLINKRYANQDARGREKKSQLSGREALMDSEMQMFWDNPILGVGVGRNKELREKETGIVSASHNEFTRMLAEHGSLGLIDLIILLFTPVVLFLINRQNILALSFLVFWLLTINHAAMRLAAPAFVYALSLLKVYTVNTSMIPKQKNE
ncbi:O-antigen ligase family protein [Flavobacterium aquicola]|uniref:O-antigen ligase-like membrane protein n=1 Tax=Flavobacterium aquicola TaxID=1682742 RepID=A0A3E0EJE0_9FLAO|nr:O-antigen ligase family protein [Flavobacterium aquicola]REG98291.1 O-antigen ligase-like membrane protein [Flavobacterium aquicola]